MTDPYAAPASDRGGPGLEDGDRGSVVWQAATQTLRDIGDAPAAHGAAAFSLCVAGLAVTAGLLALVVALAWAAQDWLSQIPGTISPGRQGLFQIVALGSFVLFAWAWCALFAPLYGSTVRAIDEHQRGSRRLGLGAPLRTPFHRAAPLVALWALLTIVLLPILSCCVLVVLPAAIPMGTASLRVALDGESTYNAVRTNLAHVGANPGPHLQLGCMGVLLAACGFVAWLSITMLLGLTETIGPLVDTVGTLVILALAVVPPMALLFGFMLLRVRVHRMWFGDPSE